jgi:predicted metal-dependent peptidase
MDKSEMEVKAAVLIRNARAALILERKFYAVLVSQVDPVPSWDFPTMATNSVQHFYNPEFIVSLPPKKVLGMQAHESEHDARHHSTRRNGRDPKRWNKACDYAINGDLIAEGFELSDGILFRKDLVGMAAEEIYRVLEIEEQQKQQQQSQSQKQEQGDEEGEGQGQEEDQDHSADDTGAKEEDQQEGQQGHGDGTRSDDTGSSNNNTIGEDSGCGEVLDAPGTEAEKADLDAKWEVVTRQAAAIAKKQGSLPGHWKSIIERRKTPTQDWRAILREYIDAGARRIDTWNRPNRRFAYSGTILQGSQRDGINKVAFIIDTSGSMSDPVLAKIAEEVQAAMDDGSISEVVTVYCDTQVNHVARYIDGDKIEFQAPWRGGTDMKPAFAWVEENEPDVSLIVCCTDLYIGDPGPEPASPALFCAWGDPRIVKQLGNALPWGKVIDCGTEVAIAT